ncbi:hypothetical protein N9Y60_00655 [Crocinitomicaceae bacterium]|nr:hypothetical protein [Crocinitomicaceae bacterium]
MKTSLCLLLILFLAVQCKPTQKTLENHAEVTANLREYEKDSFFQENYNDTVLTDYMYLSYEDYRKKYDLKHKHMDLLAKTSAASVSILKANRSITNLKRRIDSVQIRRIDTSKINTFYLDKITTRLSETPENYLIDSSTINLREILRNDSDSIKILLNQMIENYEKLMSDTLK